MSSSLDACGLGFMGLGFRGMAVSDMECMHVFFLWLLSLIRKKYY